MDNLSTNMLNIISTNVMGNVSINCYNKKYIMDCFISCTVLLCIILLFIFAISCYHCAKHRPKPKHIREHKKNFKKFCIKDRTCYCFR